MSKPRIPSLMHAVRNWHPDPEQVRKALFDIGLHAPPFSYKFLFKLVYQQLKFNDSLEQLNECINRFEKREKYREDFIAAFQLVHDYFREVNPDSVQEVTGRFYPVARDLLVPFNPPITYTKNGKRILPLICFWKKKPPRGEKLALLITLVSEIIEQDPDLEDAEIHIISLATERIKTDDGHKDVRVLKVVNGSTINRIDEPRKLVMLESIVRGYRLAKADLEHGIKPADRPDNSIDPDQMPLF